MSSAHSHAPVLTRWIAENAHPLTAVGPATPLTALERLGDLVRHAKVIGLGGSTRGAHKLSAVTNRFFRYLVVDQGFRALRWNWCARCKP